MMQHMQRNWGSDGFGLSRQTWVPGGGSVSGFSEDRISRTRIYEGAVLGEANGFTELRGFSRNADAPAQACSRPDWAFDEMGFRKWAAGRLLWSESKFLNSNKAAGTGRVISQRSFV